MPVLSSPDDLWIDNDWTLGDCETLEDYDEARVVLIDKIAMMELSLDENVVPRSARDNPQAWRLRTEKALKWKRLALQYVMERRADLRRQSRQNDHIDRQAAVLGVLRRDRPDVHEAALETAKVENPDLFGERT